MNHKKLENAFKSVKKSTLTDELLKLILKH